MKILAIDHDFFKELLLGQSISDIVDVIMDVFDVGMNSVYSQRNVDGILVLETMLASKLRGIGLDSDWLDIADEIKKITPERLAEVKEDSNDNAAE